MKKIIKSFICAIVCLALLMVPMTVMAEEGVTYNINYEANLTVGTNNYAIDSTVPYTVFILYPTAVGDYTITTDAKIGIVSYIDMWVQFEPTDEIVNLNEIKWTCTDVNQAIMIAVNSDLSEVSITVNWSDPTVVEIPWTIYENKQTPQEFVMPDFVNVGSFKGVNYQDDIIDEAVFGDDGYYHLGDKNGPVLFANLNDPKMSLYTMASNGKVSAIYYDEDGNLLKKLDYTSAFNEYVEALTDDAGSISSFYYPLSDDLIEMFKEIGATHEWYEGENPWVAATDDAWLYACYYDTNVTSLVEKEDVNGDVNFDGQLNGKDAVAIMQYINGWDVEISAELSDVYSDDIINIKDYVTLVRYLNNWDITLG